MNVALIAFRAFGRLDQFPELGVFLQGLVFTHLDARPEQEILERVPAQYAMHQHPKLVPLEVNPVIAHAKAMQDMAITFQFAEVLQLAADHMLGQTAKVAQDLKLQFFGHPRQFSGAGGCKNNLKRVHASAQTTVLTN